MKRHQRTLVALSATDADRALLAYARLLADLGFVRHYHFVHVRTAAQSVDDRRSDAEVLQACEAAVAKAIPHPPAGLSFSSHVLGGVRVDALIDFASQHCCDLVLLGHRRSRSGQRSLARRLAMIAPCSVWMIPEGAPLSIHNILAPIDFSDHAADSLQVAVSIAKAAGLDECSTVHVFSDPSTIRYDEHVDALRRNEQGAFHKFLAPIDRFGIRVEPTFMEGNHVARTILHCANRLGTDLVVMNTRGRSRAASILLGSVTTQVMTESPVAVFAVKHFGAMLNLFQALQQSHFWTSRNPKTN